MALTNWNDILNKPKGIDEVPEIAEDVGEIAEDVQEIALEVSNLSASTLPYSSTQSTKDKIDEISNQTRWYKGYTPNNISSYAIDATITIAVIPREQINLTDYYVKNVYTDYYTDAVSQRRTITNNFKIFTVATTDTEYQIIGIGLNSVFSNRYDNAKMAIEFEKVSFT